jgi:hypothetical protein
MLGTGRDAKIKLDSPIAPGYIRGIGIRRFARLPPGKTVTPKIDSGTIALDGERELSFSRGDEVSIMLETDAFRTVNVSACMHYAARRGLMRRPPHHLETAEVL